MILKEIKINKRFGIDELRERLREVRLKGFPDIKIYEDAKIFISSFSPKEVLDRVFIPQPSVYREGFLDRIDALKELFRGQGVDIVNLDGGVDYTAVDEEGNETEWTLIPPVLERVPIHFDGHGLDYSKLLTEELWQRMQAEGHNLNPQLRELAFPEYQQGPNSVLVVCDGSHRLHSHLEKGLNQNLLVIDAPKPGFPYYAAPKPYSTVHVVPGRPEGGTTDKVHVLTEPGHKLLYRLFPSGGILSGTVRPEKQ